MQTVALPCQGAAALPVALWAEVLQHVPQQQRLTQCALVCTAWAPAAAQGTVDVTHTLHEENEAALNSWLAVHAGQLQSLQLKPSPWKGRGTLQLSLAKLTKLQHLQLKDVTLQLPSDKDSHGSSAGAGSKGISVGESGHAVQLTLPSLQHLELDQVAISSISSLLQLTKAPQLTSISLERIFFNDMKLRTDTCTYQTPRPGGWQAGVQQLAEAVPGLLQQLPLLKVLQLPGFPLIDAAVQQLSAMQKLQEVSLGHVIGMPICSLQPLPSSITRLKLCSGVDPYDSEDPNLPPELPQLSGLLQLDLECCVVWPRILRSFPHLQLLRMYDCSLLPRPPLSEYATEGTEALLEVLTRLTCLRDLHVHFEGLDAVNIEPEEFSALTASSHLTQLGLTRPYDRPIARGAVQHMFPPGRQMPLLQHLTISAVQEDYPDVDEWCLHSADLTRIISSCPGLQYLDISSSVEPGADLSVLLQLPQSCTGLTVGGEAFTDATIPVLLQLTQLKRLMWVWSPGFTDAGLEQLVQLDLHSLNVYNSGITVGLCRKERGMVQIWGTPDAVKEQLDELLDTSISLGPARLERQQQQEAAAAEQGLAGSQAEADPLD